MTTNKTKTVYLLINSRAWIHAHGDILMPITTAFEVVGEWDNEAKEYVYSKCDARYFVGTFDTKKVCPHEFHSGEMRYPGFIPNIGGVSQDEILEAFQAELNAATPTNPDATRYAEMVFQFWRGELKYNAVTITEAV